MRYYLARLVRAVEDVLERPKVRRRLAVDREVAMLDGWLDL
jgi:hypothetical protein